MFMRILGIAAGAFATDQLFHIVDAFAMGLRAETMAGRIGAVLFGIAVLLVLMAVVRRVFPRSFFHGFVVAAGLFLSFDIVVFHWIFQLHRITNGPEAGVLEPVFVVAGSLLVAYGIRQERSIARPRSTGHTM